MIEDKSNNLEWIDHFQLIKKIKELSDPSKNVISENIYDSQCQICKRWFILSDPQICETNNGVNGHTPYEGLCKDCWTFIAKTTSWIRSFQKILSIPIYEYQKITIPGKLRQKIWERDNFTCQECGSKENLSTDHIKPESKGGTLNPNNLRTLCKDCNSKKGDKVKISTGS